MHPQCSGADLVQELEELLLPVSILGLESLQERVELPAALGQRVINVADSQILEMPRLPTNRHRDVIEAVPLHIQFVGEFRLIFLGFFRT
jgi:hypothetical protein